MPTSTKISENMTSRVTSKNVSSQNAVKSYTNLGYNQVGQNADVVSNVRFQQPVAVVKAFVNPGYDNSLRHVRSLPRNHSKLNYKRSITTSTFPRRKPVLYTWSLKPMDTEPQQSRPSLPITYREIHPHLDRRRATKHRSSARSRSFTKSSLKKKDRRLGSLKGVYITDSRPRRSHQQNSVYHGRSTRPSYFAPNRSKVNYKISSPSEISKAERENYADFYEERYKMVKKSEFPAFESGSAKYEATSRDLEPEISSIVSGSEFSDFLPTPPRPSDSQSEGSAGSYSRGSYKAYQNRLEKSSKSRRELVREDTSHYDRAKHTKSFQETLKSLRNGGQNDQNSVQREVATTSEATSPWINNDSNFRKQHGIPITGVPVLPPEPVYIKVEDSDLSEDEKRFEDETN
ncbi:uncharacterized protein LOC114518921 [Dendronephthya gigantea]|uniref:uncharacterized protein LOC114518921 n=1 Tax=Dendronephthya gigantea TaxID=151771 RepID=UPI00106A98CC|nr:uncharacterized protein LOC114518921 [Dendronephthya gigantea]